MVVSALTLLTRKGQENYTVARYKKNNIVYKYLQKVGYHCGQPGKITIVIILA